MSGPASPLVWQDGAPRSALYGDIYFSLEDGLAESRAVFLQGCGLPDAWTDRRAFCVAELGFGSGLNICALLDLWARTRRADQRLSIFSIEAHPLGREDAERALAAFPEVGEAAGQLLAQWPGRRRGFHRIEFAGLGATLDLAVMEAGEALEAWSGHADAWFLDGFSPALNPAMWRPEVFTLIAARSNAGARAATFTVAGDVRRGLMAAGFAVEKQPGFGRKRQRLEARLDGLPLDPGLNTQTVVIGAGIAGAALARAFTALGRPVTVIADPEAPAASGNPAALVTPALDAGGGARAALYAQAFARAVQLYAGVPDAVIDRGAVQVEAEDRDRARFDAIAAQDLFESGSVERLSPGALAAMLSEAQGPGGLYFHDGLVVDPATLLRAWLPAVTPGRVEAISFDHDGAELTLSDGRRLRVGQVVIANGLDAARLVPGLRLQPVRGQASIVAGAPAGKASAFGGYAIPTRAGVLFGATHDRGQTSLEVRDEDHARNLKSLALGRPALAKRLEGAVLTGRAGVRATTFDRLPLAGDIRPGLFVLAGLGSRGFTTAPLLAEHVAALVTGSPTPLPGPLAGLATPARLQP